MAQNSRAHNCQRKCPSYKPAVWPLPSRRAIVVVVALTVTIVVVAASPATPSGSTPGRTRQHSNSNKANHKTRIQAKKDRFHSQVPYFHSESDDGRDDGVDQSGGDDALDGALGADDGCEEMRDVDAEHGEGDQGGEELDYADGLQESRVVGVVGDGFWDRRKDVDHGEGYGEVQALTAWILER